MAKKPGTNSPKQTEMRAKRSMPKSAPKVIDLEAKEVESKKTAEAAKSIKPPQKEPAKTNTAPKAETPQKPAAGPIEKPNTKEATNKPADRSTGFGSLLAASLIGGVLALGGAWILGAFEAGNRNAPAANTAPNITNLEQRLIQLEETTTAPQTNTTSTDAIIKLIDERVAQQTNDADLAAQLGALKAQVENNAGNGELLENISTLESRLSELEANAPATSIRDEETIAALEDLATRNDILAEQVSETASIGEANGEQLAAMDERLDNMTERFAAAAQQAETVKTIARDAANTVQTLQTSIKDTLQAAETRIEQQIAILGERFENGADRLAARSLAAAALKRDIDRGEPFTASLSILQGFAQDPASLEPLLPYAAEGIAPQSALTARFSQLSADILTEVQSTSSNEGSLASRLLAGARNAVQVRRASDVEAEGPAGTIARITQALAQNDLQKASQEWQELPQAGQAISQNWHAALTARIKANAIVSQSINTFIQQAAGQN